ncbi:hypothetical protein [Methanolobus sp.]|jgi:rubredoxin|uniref:hypothetical protein n=1 Tax=Methanolobus sp. TaxID=1874737 RepID=UPI0025E1F0C6|nr:hypothetical protein [Methanolobus sp.]
MASRRSKKHGVTPGTIRGKDKNWLSEGQDQRRYNYAQDTVNTAVGRNRPCPKCRGTSGCFNAAVLKGYGARSWWSCSECGHEYIMEISPEKMEQYYQEDLAKMVDRMKAPEAEA